MGMIKYLFFVKPYSLDNWEVPPALKKGGGGIIFALSLTETCQLSCRPSSPTFALQTTIFICAEVARP